MQRFPQRQEHSEFPYFALDFARFSHQVWFRRFIEVILNLLELIRCVVVILRNKNIIQNRNAKNISNAPNILKMYFLSYFTAMLKAVAIIYPIPTKYEKTGDNREEALALPLEKENSVLLRHAREKHKNIRFSCLNQPDMSVIMCLVCAHAWRFA